MNIRVVLAVLASAAGVLGVLLDGGAWALAAAIWAAAYALEAYKPA